MKLDKLINSTRFIVIIIIMISLLFCLNEPTVWGQCPMCKAAAESNLKEGGKHGLGLNSGILYLLVMPYLIFFIIGYWWWRNQKRAAITEQP